MDLYRAFEYVDLNKLKRHGIKRLPLELMTSYLTNLIIEYHVFLPVF